MAIKVVIKSGDSEFFAADDDRLAMSESTYNLIIKLPFLFLEMINSSPSARCFRSVRVRILAGQTDWTSLVIMVAF